MNKQKIQIVSIYGSVLFEYEEVDNTIAKTLKEAVSKGANLDGANLYGANLDGANLRGANLERANLRGANLYGANLYGANLYGANLYGANLERANLRGANLERANLRGANLERANLDGANLERANLDGANLDGANLDGANLRGVNPYGANLEQCKQADLIIAQTRILPEGDIIGYKKCREDLIVKLLIPADAKRSHAFGRKCRAEFAKVLEISNGAQQAISKEDESFQYKVGDTVRPTKEFDLNWKEECSTGIHFFISRIEAENY